MRRVRFDAIRDRCTRAGATDREAGALRGTDATPKDVPVPGKATISSASGLNRFASRRRRVASEGGATDWLGPGARRSNRPFEVGDERLGQRPLEHRDEDARVARRGAIRRRRDAGARPRHEGVRGADNARKTAWISTWGAPRGSESWSGPTAGGCSVRRDQHQTRKSDLSETSAYAMP